MGRARTKELGLTCLVPRQVIDGNLVLHLHLFQHVSSLGQAFGVCFQARIRPGDDPERSGQSISSKQPNTDIIMRLAVCRLYCSRPNSTWRLARPIPVAGQHLLTEAAASALRLRLRLRRLRLRLRLRRRLRVCECAQPACKAAVELLALTQWAEGTPRSGVGVVKVFFQGSATGFGARLE